MSDTWLPIPDHLTPVDPRTINIPSRGAPDPYEIPQRLRPVRFPTMEEFDSTLRQSFQPEIMAEFDRQVNELTRLAEDPEEEKARIYNSLILSLMTGNNPDYVYSLHDSFIRAWTGDKKEKPVTFGQKLNNSIKSSLIPGRMMPLILRQMMGDDSAELEQAIQELEREIPPGGNELNLDAIKALNANTRHRERNIPVITPFMRLLKDVGRVLGAEDRGAELREVAGERARAAVPFAGVPEKIRGIREKLGVAVDVAKDLTAGIREKGVRGFAEESVLEAARILPMQIQAMLRGGVPGTVFGMGTISAGGLLAAGAVGPEAAAPFIAALPAAGKLGFQVGTTGYIGLIEATQSYRDLMRLTWTDADGNVQKIDKAYAVAASLAVGVVNGLIEYVQIRTLMQGIPGAEKLFQRAAKRATEKVLAEKTLGQLVLGKLAKGTGRYAGRVIAETGEEVAQEAVTAIFAEIIKDINNAVKGTDFADDWKGILPRMLEVAKSTAKGFAFLSIFGSTIQTAVSLKKVVEGKADYSRAIAHLKEAIDGLTDEEARDILRTVEKASQEQTKRTQEMVSEGRLVEKESRSKRVMTVPKTEKEASAEAKAVPSVAEVTFREVSPKEFVEVRDQMAPERRPFITLFSVKELKAEYKGARYFISQEHGGLVGYAISKDGELFGLFNNSGVRGLGREAIAQAIENGATHLFAFETLEPLYEEFGFETYKREPWNPEYAPANWDYETYGTPDVIWMRLREEGDRAIGPVSEIEAPAEPGPVLPEEYKYNPDNPQTFKESVFAIGTDDGSIYFDPDAYSHMDAAKNLGIPAASVANLGFITKEGVYRIHKHATLETPKQRLLSKIRELQKINPHIKDEQLPYFFQALEENAKSRGLTLDQALRQDLVDEMISTAALDDAMKGASEEYMQTEVHTIFKELAAKEPDPIQPPGRGDHLNVQLQTQLRERARQRSLQEIGSALAAGLDLDPALDWYRGAIDEMMKLTTEIIPELAKPENATLFRALLAITSSGTPVRDNYNFTVEIMRSILRTGKLPIDETTYSSAFTGETRTVLALMADNGVEEAKIVGGPQLQNVRLNAERIQLLIDKMGVKKAVDFLVKKHPGREILDFFGVDVHQTVTKRGEHYGAEIFGPKIGPYFLNLTGNHDILVADRWFVRTWNRWMGTWESGKAQEETIQSPRNKTERRAMQESMEQVAAELSEITGQTWGIDQVQAVLWYLEKALYEKSGLTNEQGISYKETANERYRRYKQGTDLGRAEEKEVSDQIRGKEDLGLPQEEVDGAPYFLYQVSPMYHGTFVDFDEFSLEFAGAGEGASSFGFGLYFTSNQEIAEYYAELTAKKRGGRPNVYEVSIDGMNWLDWWETVDKDMLNYFARLLRQERQNLLQYPTKLQTKHYDQALAGLERYGKADIPYTYTGQDVYGLLSSALGSDQKASAFLATAGVDGVRYPANSLAAVQAGEKPNYSAGTNYVAFTTDQVTIHNHTLYSTYKAAVQFMKDGRALIHATRHTDLSSLLHEMAHIWRRKVSDPTVIATISKWVNEDPANWHKWSRASEEKFARAFEQLFAEGIAPTPELRAVFSAMKRWLKGLVRYVNGVPLPAEVREALGKMLTPRDPSVLGDTASIWELMELERENRILYDMLTDEDSMDENNKASRRSAEEVEQSYRVLKDLWFANKDERVFVSKVESQQLQERILQVARRIFQGKEAKNMARKYDEAMHLYIDLKRDLTAIDRFYEFLTPYQKEIVDLSQKLPEELRNMADEIGQVYLETGREAQDHEIIRNLIDNYVSRAWIMGKEAGKAKFKTQTVHARHREFRTILEGWAQGYDLRYKSASVAMREYRVEMVRVIEDKRFLKALAQLKGMDGNPILSDKQLEGYEQVEHPNFKLWKYAGTAVINILKRTISEYFEKTRETRRETGGTESKTPGAVRKLEEVIVNSLMIRGYTEGEARNALSSVKRAGSKEDVTVIVTEIEKVAKEHEQIVAETFKKVFGKNFVLLQDGTILERRDLYAPAEVAKNLNNILGRSRLMDQPVVRAITKFNAIVKSIILQSSMFHHFAFARSYYLGTNHKAWMEMNIFKAYKEGKKAIRSLQPEILLGVRNGLTLGVLQDWDEELVLEPTFLDKWLDKVGFAKGLRDGVKNAQKWWADRLFDSFGAGLKAKSFLIEYRNQLTKYPGEDPNVIAARVANLINDDFGGLHLGRMGRNPTTQHLLRILLLAPDWTESNFRTVTKAMGIAFEGGDVVKLNKAERRMYQAFWAKALIKGLAATVFLNFLGAGGDPERFLDNYRQALAAGNMRVLDIDITWLWRALGGKGTKRKYLSLIGHFKDPLKWVRFPLKSVRHKLAVGPSTAIEALTKKDWAGRSFTTFGELLETGQTVAWWVEDGATTDYSWLPSFIINQLAGYTPIQVQNLMAAISGEQDWFESIGNMVGLGIRSTY